MIPRDYITSWRAKVPWVQDFQVEQDLVISRALVEMFSKSEISTALAFRGGTALHKLHMNPPAQYSEDIDLVQVRAGAIGPTLTALRGVLDSWLRARKEEMAAFLMELVAIPTENPPGRKYRACAELLERRMHQLGLDCKRFEPVGVKNEADDAPVCLLASFGSGERSLYFHGHYDVVPAQSVEHFQPSRKEHFLFGRGSCDMKVGIVTMLYAILAVKGCGEELNGKIGLVLVPDEETGGERDSAWPASDGLLGQNGIGMLLAEPTSGVVWNANRGAISPRVRVLGRAAHVGIQHQGANAFERGRYGASKYDP